MANEEQQPMSEARLAADVLRRWFLSVDAIDSDQLQKAVRTAIDALTEVERLRTQETHTRERLEAAWRHNERLERENDWLRNYKAASPAEAVTDAIADALSELPVSAIYTTVPSRDDSEPPYVTITRIESADAEDDQPLGPEIHPDPDDPFWRR